MRDEKLFGKADATLDSFRKCANDRPAVKKGEKMKKMRAGKVVLLLIVFVMGITSFACKKKEFSIVGTWNISYSLPTGPGSWLLSFQGSDDSGDIFNASVDDQKIGYYSVVGENVNFTTTLFWNDYLGDLVFSFKGSSSDDDEMGGSITAFHSNFPTDQVAGSWTGTR